MALRRNQRRTQQSKLDATPPWDSKPVDRGTATTGPFDVLDAPGSDGTERMDLGALQVPVDRGLELRVAVGDNGLVTELTFVSPDGQMQIGLFAAPRTEGIWDDVRPEIKASISAQGGTVQEETGDFGAELTGKLPAPGGFTPVRFIGVDGPRWFLRAMLAGGPATDVDTAAPFISTFRDIIVVRGTDPLPVREPVPMTLPRDAAEQIEAASQQQEATDLVE
jgi:hypothetical protein